MVPDLTTREDMLAVLDQERATTLELLPRFSDEKWRAIVRDDGWSSHDIAMHLADSNYGLALLVLGEVQPSMPLNDRGWMDVDDLNEMRRQKNVALSRDKVLSRMDSSFAHARRAIEATEDFDAPGPYGPVHTKGQWLRRLIEHAQSHREELASALEA